MFLGVCKCFILCWKLSSYGVQNLSGWKMEASSDVSTFLFLLCLWWKTPWQIICWCHLSTAEMDWAGTRQPFFINNAKQLFWAENWKSRFSCWICHGETGVIECTCVPQAFWSQHSCAPICCVEYSLEDCPFQWKYHRIIWVGKDFLRSPGPIC